MEADSGTPLSELKIDGGITANKFVLQFLADLLERKVTNIAIADVSALGAAYLAGLQSKIYKSLEQLQGFNQTANSTLAGDGRYKAKQAYKGWKNVIG